MQPSLFTLFLAATAVAAPQPNKDSEESDGRPSRPTGTATGTPTGFPGGGSFPTDFPTPTGGASPLGKNKASTKGEGLDKDKERGGGGGKPSNSTSLTSGAECEDSGGV